MTTEPSGQIPPLVEDDVVHHQTAPYWRPHSAAVVVNFVSGRRSTWLHFAGGCRRDHETDGSACGRNSVRPFAWRDQVHRRSDVDRTAGPSRRGLPRPSVRVASRRPATFHAADGTDGEMGRRACGAQAPTCVSTTGTGPKRAWTIGPRVGKTQETGEVRGETARGLSLP